MKSVKNSRGLFFLDLIFIYGSFFFSYIIFLGNSTVHYKAIALMAVIGILYFVISLNSNLNRINIQSKIVEIIKDVLVAYAVLSVGLITIVACFSNFMKHNKFLLYPLLISFFFSIFSRLFTVLFFKHLIKNGYQQKMVLLIGKSGLTERIVKKFFNFPELGYRLYGIISDESITNLPKGVYLGKSNRLEEILNSTIIDEVFIALPMSQNDKIKDILARCEFAGIRAKIIPDFYDIINSRLMLDELDDIPLLSVRPEPLILLRNRFIKRTFDVAFSFTIIIGFFPLFFLIAILIKITSHGPVFFKQTRIGANNKEFTIYKFRTMKVQNQKDSDTIWTTENDQRVTSLGKFLRKFNLDEIPQFYNVLIGNMSVVGPRPEREFFVEKFKQDINNYKIRHLVKTGITGLAQVNGWRGDSSINKRIENDIHYIENWSFWLDIKIIFLTLFGKHTQKNAY